MSLTVPVNLDVNVLPPEIDAVRDVLLEEAPEAPGEVVRLGWAREGGVVGKLQTLETAGGAGESADATADSADTASGESGTDSAVTPFAIGDGLEIVRDRLVAVSEGILRIGNDWADLVPCRTHRWELNGDIDEGGCLLDFFPGNPNISPPSVQDILAAAGRLGFPPGKILPEDDLRAILTDAVENRSTLEGYPVSRDVDAAISLEIDPHRLKAELVLRKGAGNGTALELNEIAARIRNSGLRGLDGPAVKAAILKFHKGRDRVVRILLKEGKAPQRGPDRELDFTVSFVDDQELSAIRDRISDDPETVRGVTSLGDFPLETVTAMAPVQEGETVAVLKSAVTGTAGRDIDGNVLTGYPGNDPNIELYESLEWQDGNLVSTDSGILDIGDSEDATIRMRVRPHQDAQISVVISPDALRAMVSIRPPHGSGAPADSQRIRDAAEQAGVLKGLLDDEIERIVQLTHTGEIATGELIAEGRLPMEGNTHLSLNVTGDPAKAPVPVKEGQTIGEIQTDEESGWNVRGEPLMDDGGRVGTGDYIDRREEDEGRTVLIAEKSGHLVMENGKLSIRHLLDYVGDVSLASGNIRFPGRIKVEGSVLSRVVVDAGDGIEVTEVVQAALVNSGADIRVGKGIKGEGKAVLRCQGQMNFSYAEDANLLATGNIIAAKALMNCRVKCNGRLSIPGDSGRVIGGLMKLKDGLDIFDLGNERGAETVVSFGQDYLVENQIDQIVKEQKKIQEFMNEADKMMAERERKGNKNGLIAIRQKKVDALKLLNKKSLRLFLLREKFEKHFDTNLTVRGTLWPGVTIESHGRFMKISEPVRRVVISFNSELGRLERRPLS